MSSSGLRTVRTMCPMNCHPTLCGMLVDIEDGLIMLRRPVALRNLTNGK